ARLESHPADRGAGARAKVPGRRRTDGWRISAKAMISQLPRKALDNKSCQWSNAAVLDLEVIDDPAAAMVALDPVRARLLAELVEPGSAASLAPRMGLARQKVNYHLRALEAHGLVRPVEERRWGGLVDGRL